MRKLLYLFILGLIPCSIFSQSNDIVLGHIDTIDSKILEEQRKIWIYVPSGGDGNLYAKESYPVVYLLDGSGHFFSTVGMVHQLSTVNGNTICPKMIVVGITNTNRMRDLTPSKPNPGDDPFLPEAMLANTGGGENFMSFIEDELIPYIDANYPTEPFKTFIGHSLGGLMVMHTFFKKPELFNAYVSIDPSMSWHKQQLLKEIKQVNLDETYANRMLFMGFANTMPTGVDTTMVKDMPSPMTAHIRSIMELNTYLNQHQDKLNYQGRYYADDDHGSVPFIGGYDALRFIFQFYRLKLGPQDFMDPNIDVVNKIQQHYEKLSATFGYEKKPAEDFLNSMAYQFMNMQMLDRSEQLFQLNASYYPDRFNVYDSLGDLYLAKGNKEKAIENFKKAIALNEESTITKEKLEKLEKQ